MSTRSWLLLIYQLPSRHSPARVKVWRRLQRIGAVLLKNSAWVMPESDDAREDFEWLKAEIVASGGDAMVLVAHAAQKATEDEIVAAFRAARADDFDALRKDASKLLQRWSTPHARSRRSTEASSGAKADATSAGRALPQTLRRIRERARELEAIDFFRSPSSDEVGQLVAQLDRHARRGQAMKASR